MESVSARQAWTDDRMDDLVQHLDTGFAQVNERMDRADRRFEQHTAEMRAESQQLRHELVGAVTSLREELHTEIGGVRQDIVGVREELHTEIGGVRQEIAGVREELHTEIGGVRQDIAGVREELHTEIGGVRAESSAMGAELNRRFDTLQQILIAALFGGLFAFLVAILTVIVPRLS